MLLTGPPADALQEPESPRERTRLEGELKRYHGIINSYREGNDESVDAILAWDPERLKKIVAAARRTPHVRSRVSDPHINQPELGIDRNVSPDSATANLV